MYHYQHSFVIVCTWNRGLCKRVNKSLSLYVLSAPYLPSSGPKWPNLRALCASGKPSCRQTTVASLRSQKSEQTVPHVPLKRISTLPSNSLEPSLRRIGRSVPTVWWKGRGRVMLGFTAKLTHLDTQLLHLLCDDSYDHPTHCLNTQQVSLQSQYRRHHQAKLPQYLDQTLPWLWLDWHWHSLADGIQPVRDRQQLVQCGT